MSHDELRHGAKHRLQALRADAAKLAANPHRNMHVAANPNWRIVRYRKFSDKYPRACMGRIGPDAVITAFAAHHLPVRDVRDCGDVIRMRHTGWFTDEGCQEYMLGIVCRLTHGRFVAGYRWTSNDEYVIFVGEIFTDEDDCARMADEHARVTAETEKEYDIRWNAAQRLQSLIEDKTRDVSDWFPSRDNPRIREDIRDTLADIRAFQRELSDDYSDIDI